MDGFMVAFNAEDADAMRKHWFNFPHVRFHGGRVTIMERPEDFHSTVWERLGEAKGWARYCVGLRGVGRRRTRQGPFSGPVYLLPRRR